VKFRSQVEVELEKYSCRIIVYMAEIGENCILGAVFCLQMRIDEVFRSAILESSQGKKPEHLFCRQNSSTSKGVPDRYRELFERDSQEMDVSQRGIFADFLKNFRMYFLNRSLLEIVILCSMKLNCQILVLLNKLLGEFLLVSERR